MRFPYSLYASPLCVKFFSFFLIRFDCIKIRWKISFVQNFSIVILFRPDFLISCMKIDYYLLASQLENVRNEYLNICQLLILFLAYYIFIPRYLLLNQYWRFSPLLSTSISNPIKLDSLYLICNLNIFNSSFFCLDKSIYRTITFSHDISRFPK